MPFAAVTELCRAELSYQCGRLVPTEYASSLRSGSEEEEEKLGVVTMKQESFNFKHSSFSTLFNIRVCGLMWFSGVLEGTEVHKCSQEPRKLVKKVVKVVAKKKVLTGSMLRFLKRVPYQPLKITKA